MNNVVGVCALLAATAAVVVTAYNFEDSEFNQILARDLEDIYDSYEPISHPRTRRDEEAVQDKEKCRPPKHRGKLCCGDSVIDGIHEKDKDAKRACFKELYGKDMPDRPKFHHDPFSCEEAQKRKKETTCVIQCVGQKHGLLDADGNLKAEEFESFLKEGFSSESWLTSLQDKIISTCLAEAKNATANRDASDTESCNPTGINTIRCLFREIQLSCPAEQIKDEKSCAKLQEKLKSNDFFPPPPPPPGPNDELDK